MEQILIILIVILVIWFFIALLDKEERHELGERLESIINTPLALSIDKDSKSFFSRDVLVDLYELLSLSIRRLRYNFVAFSQWGKKQISDVSKEKTLKAFFYSLNTFLLVAFLYSDIIAISSSLATLMPTLDVPEYLWNYATAVTFGSVFSIIIGGLIVNDIVQGKSEFSDWGEQVNITAKSIPLLMSIFIIISGFISVVGLGLARLNVLLPSLSEQTKNAIEQITSGTINVLVPVNVALATFLIFFSGIKGIAVLLGVMAILVSFLSAILAFILQIMISIIIFILDLAFRVAMSVALIIYFFIVTPIDMVGRLFIKR